MLQCFEPNFFVIFSSFYFHSGAHQYFVIAFSHLVKSDINRILRSRITRPLQSSELGSVHKSTKIVCFDIRRMVALINSERSTGIYICISVYTMV